MKEVIQKIQLVDGSFTASEAADVVAALIDVKINFHKIQRLSLREGHENSNVRYPNERIAELEEAKKVAKDFIKKARGEGYNVKINGTLEISFNNEELSINLA